MKIAVFGGTGATGSRIIEQALANGISVKTLVRNPDKLTIHDDRLESMKGNAMDASDVSAVIEGTEAVFSALGSDGLGETMIFSVSIRHIIAGMQLHRIRRFLGVGAVGQDPERSGNVPVMGKIFINLVIRKPLEDMYRMQRILEGSELDWTVIWPPRLSYGPQTGTYRTANGESLKKGAVISRADVAHFMLRNMGNPEYYKQCTAIAY